MTQLDQLKHAMRNDPKPSKREIRAARTRAHAFSPMRIGMSLLSFPVVTVSVALSLYIRTSAYEPTAALAHLVARVSCDAARSVGLAPAYRGEIGYHVRNDPDGDGVACERSLPAQVQQVLDTMLDTPAPSPDQPAAPDRMVGGAKFIKP
jgi:Excalibur calcium-binding domain